jgi:hypothetical protein
LRGTEKEVGKRDISLSVVTSRIRKWCDRERREERREKERKFREGVRKGEEK